MVASESRFHPPRPWWICWFMKKMALLWHRWKMSCICYMTIIQNQFSSFALLSWRYDFHLRLFRGLRDPGRRRRRKGRRAISPRMTAAAKNAFLWPDTKYKRQIQSQTTRVREERKEGHCATVQQKCSPNWQYATKKLWSMSSNPRLHKKCWQFVRHQNTKTFMMNKTICNIETIHIIQNRPQHRKSFMIYKTIHYKEKIWCRIVSDPLA